MKLSFSRSREWRSKIKNTPLLKKVVLILLSVFVMFVFVSFFYAQHYNTGESHYDTLYTFSDPVGSPLGNNDLIKQPFFYGGRLQGINLAIGTYGKKLIGNLEVTLWYNDEKLADASYNLSAVDDCKEFQIYFNNEIFLNEGVYFFSFMASGMPEGDQIVFLGQNIDSLEQENLLQVNEPDEKTAEERNAWLELEKLAEDSAPYKASINNQEMDIGVGMQLIGYSNGFLKAAKTFVFVSIGLMIVLVLLEGVILFANFKLENLFVIIACALMLCYQFITVPISTPDEGAHLTMSYYYSGILMGKNSKQELLALNQSVKNGEIQQDKLLMLSDILDRESYYNVFDAIGDHSVSILTFYDRYFNVSALAYLPSILGLSIGRLLDISQMGMIYMGRFFSGAAYICLSYLGIKKIPGNKATLFLIALLPISLHLGASFSYDSLLIGASILFTGLLFSLYEKTNEISLKEIILLLICIFIFTSCKGVYIILLGMLFLVPVHVWGGKFKRKLYFLAFTSLSAMLLLVNLGEQLSKRNEIALAKNNLQMSIIWQKPIDFLLLLINTFLEQIDLYFQGALGGYLGSFQFRLPLVLCFFVFSLLVISCLYQPARSLVIKKEWRIAGVIVCLLIVAAFFASAISWNQEGATVIGGVQGRYFLQILPLLLLLLFSWKQLELKTNITASLILCMLFVNIYSLLTVIDTVLQS